jgi:hypothetical protein
MRRLMLALVAVGALAAGSGCAIVTSSMPSSTSVTGEAWYTEAIGFIGITWGSKVWYCPPPSSGPQLCKEAKMIELTKVELGAQKAAEKAASGK